VRGADGKLVMSAASGLNSGQSDRRRNWSFIYGRFQVIESDTYRPRARARPRESKFHRGRGTSTRTTTNPELC